MNGHGGVRVTGVVAPCGTYAGYQRHKKFGETPCQRCRDANAAYVREWRSDPDNRARTQAANNARQRALQRLADEYPKRFLELLNEERLTIYRGESA